MKVKELIKQLQELDPSGELQVEIGGPVACGAIQYLAVLPGYYDGHCEYLEPGENEKFILDDIKDKIRIYFLDRQTWAGYLRERGQDPTNLFEIKTESAQRKHWYETMIKQAIRDTKK